MKKLKQILILSVSMGLVACSPRYYSPNTHNVALISEQGETNLTLSGNNDQFEFQGAYGITKNIAIQGNVGMYIPADLDNGDGGSGKFFEVGGGYYNALTENIVFETYGLLGLGSMENHFPSSQNTSPLTMGDISANILRVGIQPNLGYKTKYFSIAISTRLVNLFYNNIKGDLIYGNISQPDYLKDNASQILLEPAITFRTGFERLKFQLQYGLSANLTNSEFDQDRQHLTIGLNFNFK